MRKFRLAAAGAVVLALGGTVAAAASSSDQQTVTIVVIAPREITVDAAAVTLADVTYGFDHSDNDNPGVSFEFFDAGFSELAFKAGPDGATVTAELTKLEDVTDTEAPVAVTWASVFGATPAGDFSLRLGGFPDCTPNIADACVAVAANSTLPAIEAATTPGPVTEPVPLRVAGASGAAAPAELVGSTSFSIAPLGKGVTGTIGIEFRYFGTAAFPDGGTAPRTIEVGLSYVISDF
jgi:hypothetical protein